MSRKLLLLLLLVASLCAIPGSVAAHILITDETGSTGAILHVVPDDDPVAGEPSTLYFDIQDNTLMQNAHSADLTITGENGQAAVPVRLSGGGTTADYTFPSQGAYKMALTVNGHNASDRAVFNHTQRVSRGLASSPSDKPTHAWADMTLVFSVCVLAVLGIVGFNRRKEIAAYSRF